MHPVLVQDLARDRHLSMRAKAYARRRAVSAGGSPRNPSMLRGRIRRAVRRAVDLARTRGHRGWLGWGEPSTSPPAVLARR